MKNYRTPRTLADADFLVGHRIASPAPRRASLAEIAYFAAACIALGVLIARAL